MMKTKRAYGLLNVLQSSEWQRGLKPAARGVTLVALWMVLIAGCGMNPGERMRLLKEVDQVKVRNEHLERLMAQRDERVAELTRQVEDLRKMGPGRSFDTFAPVSLKMASLSRGSDFDGKPGDDGVTLYLQPMDADGDIVKAPGKIRVQVLDNAQIGSPQVLAVCEYNDLDELRKTWHGKFLTQHYSLDCPFDKGMALPSTRQVNVTVEFLSLLTGETLRVSKDLPIAFTDSGQQ